MKALRASGASEIRENTTLACLGDPAPDILEGIIEWQQILGMMQANPKSIILTWECIKFITNTIMQDKIFQGWIKEL